MKALSLFLLLSLFIMASCGNGDKSTSQQEKANESKKDPVLGEYVYLDRAFVLHTKNGCKAVYKDHNIQEVCPITIDDVTRNNLRRVCSQCVTEEQLILMSEYISAKEEAFETDTIAGDYDPDVEL